MKKVGYWENHKSINLSEMKLLLAKLKLDLRKPDKQRLTAAYAFHLRLPQYCVYLTKT